MKQPPPKPIRQGAEPGRSDSGSRRWITVEVERTGGSRSLWIVATIILTAVLFHLFRPASVQLDFVIPENCASSILKLRAPRASSRGRQPAKGTLVLEFAEDGTCVVGGDLPVLRWHRISARFRSGGAIPWMPNTQEVSADQVGLRSVGVKDRTEAWFVIGTQGDAARARREMAGAGAGE